MAGAGQFKHCQNLQMGNKSSSGRKAKAEPPLEHNDESNEISNDSSNVAPPESLTTEDIEPSVHEHITDVLVTHTRPSVEELVAPLENRPSQELRTGNRVELVPHQHTLFCERKERVCTAVGRVQELESLRVVLEVKGEGYWIRSRDSVGEESTAVSSNDRETYTLSKDDIGFYIGYKFMQIGESSYSTLNCLGPVLPSPPRILDLKITFESTELTPGCVMSAVGSYLGGIEGKSLFWWIRIRNGVRENINEPTEVIPGSDARRYVIATEDVGCQLKVKCRPVRDDGCKGEIFTSKACPKIANCAVSA